MTGEVKQCFLVLDVALPYKDAEGAVHPLVVVYTTSERYAKFIRRMRQYAGEFRIGSSGKAYPTISGDIVMTATTYFEFLGGESAMRKMIVDGFIFKPTEVYERELQQWKRDMENDPNDAGAKPNKTLSLVVELRPGQLSSKRRVIGVIPSLTERARHYLAEQYGDYGEVLLGAEIMLHTRDLTHVLREQGFEVTEVKP